MSTGYFQVPKKDIVKSKTMTVLCMIGIFASLYFTFYALFFRTVDVDITQDIRIVYEGESGSASVKIFNPSDNYNQRIQEFMDTVTYQVTPNKNLKNGDTLSISTKYDQKVLDRYHIQPVGLKREVKVEKLPERITNVQELSLTFLEELNKKGDAYLKKNMTMILADDFTDFHIKSKPTLVENKKMYRLFLDAVSNVQKDKIIDIFAIKAKGEINVSSTNEKLETKESIIYYMVTYNEINTAQTIRDGNMYGEKMIIKGNENLGNEKEFKAFMNSKYGAQYKLSYLPIIK